MSKDALLNGKRILLVDDEPDILEVMEELLTVCELTLASTFERAAELLECRELDLAVLDIMGVNGYRLLEIARRRNIPALMLTAHAFTARDLVKSIKAGAASFIPKNELGNIREFLIEFFDAQQQGRNAWEAWRERLPASYFERPFGEDWQDADRDFWDAFWADLKKTGKK